MTIRSHCSFVNLTLFKPIQSTYTVNHMDASSENAPDARQHASMTLCAEMYKKNLQEGSDRPPSSSTQIRRRRRQRYQHPHAPKLKLTRLYTKPRVTASCSLATGSYLDDHLIYPSPDRSLSSIRNCHLFISLRPTACNNTGPNHRYR